MRVFTHAHVSMITYRVDVYRRRPRGASLLAGRGRHTRYGVRQAGADADRYRCACLSHGLDGRDDVYQYGLDWGHPNVSKNPVHIAAAEAS